jgi:hypothetical protein
MSIYDEPKSIIFGKVCNKQWRGKTVFYVELRKYFKHNIFEPYDDLILLDVFESRRDAIEAVYRRGFHAIASWGDANDVIRSYAH